MRREPLHLCRAYKSMLGGFYKVIQVEGNGGVKSDMENLPGGRFSRVWMVLADIQGQAS
jgi:hypothetical protein